MSTISPESVKELRERTGISVMQCKVALEEAGGDMEKAMLLLRKKGSSIADKKGDRALGAGVLAAYTHANKKVVAVVELQSETDFVAKNEEFVKLAYELALQVAASNPQYVRREDVPEEEMAKYKDMYKGDVEGKPENLKETILAGKLDAFMKGVALMEQTYIKDDSLTIKQLLDNATQKFGERIEVGTFKRFTTK